MKSRVEQLAVKFGHGQATAAQVVAALTLRGRKPRSKNLAAEDALGVDPELPSAADSWSDVQRVYDSGGLSEEQFRQLYRAAFPLADTSARGGT